MQNIFLSILEISVSIGVVVIVLILLSPFLNKRYAAKWKYLIWIFLALRLIVPFSGVNGKLIGAMLSQMKNQSVSESEQKYTDAPDNVLIPYRRIIVEIPAQMTTPIKAQSERNKVGITILDIAAFVWIITGLVFISVHVISYACYKRQIMKNGRMIKDEFILNQVFKLKCELHIRRIVCVMEYCGAESPMIIGFFKPVLVLPNEQYSPEDLFFILKHELVHLNRGDMYLKLLFVIANAVHWFNPLIWIMQKEAVIDMELSCDERVTQGVSYAMRKAYTETLLSMLHKQCAKRTVLSTQFYGGKNIMKKRFKNILTKKRKKNGISILICGIILTISMGAVVGCSVVKENIEKKNIEKKDSENVSNHLDWKSIQTEAKDIENSPDEDNTSLLIFSKEGKQEQKRATLVIGNGYSIYLPDDEEWQMSAPDLWTTGLNGEIALWITHFEGESMSSVRQKLKKDGYVKEDYHKWWKQEGDLIYHAEQETFENDVWGIFYSYPADYEEGWGSELPVIANTFALSAGAEKDNGRNNSSGEYLENEDCQIIKTILDEFAAAYFSGNASAIQKFLASTYEGEIGTYEGTGAISELAVKGLSEADEKKIENGECVVSLEFRDSNYEDMFLYLNLILVKEENSWKIQFYGVEG